MANNIELITKYSTKAWDKVYKAEAISSLLDAPEAQVQFTGAKTVKIAKFSASGLGNYYRDGAHGLPGLGFGYAGGNVGLVWEEFTLSQDRSARYPVEFFDNEETDGLVLGAATTEISRTIMVPEVDAYCFSTVASYVNSGATSSTVPTADNAIKLLNDGLLYLEEHEVPAEKQIIFVSPRFMNLLRNGNQTIARLLQADFDKDVKFSLTSYEGRKLAVVPPQRFKTEIDTTGVGYTWGEDSKEINFMIVATDAVMHVVKYNKIKILSGDINLAGGNFDGYSIFARIYHDVFVPDNKTYALYMNTGTITANSSTLTDLVQLKAVKGKELRFGAGDKLCKAYKTTGSANVGDEITVGATETEVKNGDIVVAGTYIVVVDGKVAAKKVVA